MRALSAALVVLATGCTVEAPIGGETVDYQIVGRVPATFRHEVDLLFVVDDDAGTARLQAQAAALWTHLSRSLGYAEGGYPDVRIGVVSSDLGVSGEAGAAVPGCSGWGDDGAFQALLSVDADVDLTAALALGEEGCRFGQPLAAMSRALARDFVREGSALAVVLVSAGDDCSVAPGAGFFGDGVDEYACFTEGVVCDGDDVGAGARTTCEPRDDGALVGIEAERRDLLYWKEREAVVVTGLFGDADRVDVVQDGDGLAVAPACGGDGDALFPAVRLGAFVAAGGGVPDGLCTRTVDQVATPAAYDLRDALGHRCLRGPIADVEPWQPGRQIDCDVVAIDELNRRHPLESCPNPNRVFEADGPCYAIKTGVAACDDFETQLGIQINWGELSPGPDAMEQPAGWTVEVGCVVDTVTQPE